MAEIISFYFPTYANRRSYFRASSKANKEVNWNHLNSAVLLRKFGIRLSKETIHELTEAHSGAIERVAKKSLFTKSRISTASKPIDRLTVLCVPAKLLLLYYCTLNFLHRSYFSCVPKWGN